MWTSGCLFVSVRALGVCVTEPDTSTIAADSSDPACGVAAAARSRDAQINGYDEQTQELIAQEAYKSCLLWNKKSVLVDSGRH